MEVLTFAKRAQSPPLRPRTTWQVPGLLIPLGGCAGSSPPGSLLQKVPHVPKSKRAGRMSHWECWETRSFSNRAPAQTGVFLGTGLTHQNRRQQTRPGSKRVFSVSLRPDSALRGSLIPSFPAFPPPPGRRGRVPGGAGSVRRGQLHQHGGVLRVQMSRRTPPERHQPQV